MVGKKKNIELLKNFSIKVHRDVPFYEKLPKISLGDTAP